MFSSNEPAGSISELLHFLLSNTPERYIFRGQTRDYPHLIPSRFRQGLSGAPANNGWIGLDNDKHNAELSDRDRVKSMVRRGLMQTLGKGLGNIIAQQYGLASETIDVTESHFIAAFFATRSFPSYSHYTGSEENRVGVIYRFQRWPKPRDFPHLEGMMSVMSLDNYQGIKKTWFRRRVALPALAYQGNKDAIKRLNDYFEENGAREDDMQTNHARVHFSDLVDIYEGVLCSDGSPHPNLKVSRMAAQRGGFMYPVVWHRCIHPTKLTLKQADWEGEYFAFPDLIAIRDSVAVHDLKGCPDFEAFFFKHGPATIDSVTREQLWPDRNSDPVRVFVEDLSEKIGVEYLADYTTTVGDPETGLVDPGYYDNSRK